jgi:hypothetical protein
MNQNKIYIPTKDADSWKEFLADKTKHWQKGYSAMETALSWEKAKDIPKEIRKTLATNPNFQNLELLLALPEYKVSLPGGNKSSQNDILALFRTENALSVMTVEGKAKEDFDSTIIDWKKNSSQKAEIERLGFLIDKIGIKGKEIDNLRYQLFHRLASAVIMAEKFHAKNAIMIIQSFNDNNKANHFDDFAKFLELYEISSVEKSKLYKLTEIKGIEVFAGWVYSDCHE